MRLSALVRRLTASNPSPMTGAGTNTYLIGTGDVSVVDPGPDDAQHREAIGAALGQDRVAWILVTHAHPDHAPGAGALSQRTGAPVLVFPRTLHDGGVLTAGGATIDILHTPGHTADHVCFLLREERALFSGDMIINGSTVVIAPPDGDMTAYLRSLDRLRDLRMARIYPGHGEVIDDPERVVEEYIAHRMMRERQILGALRDGPARIPGLVSRIYTEVPQVLHRPAAQSVYAHLLKLKAEGRVAGTGLDSEWRLI